MSTTITIERRKRGVFGWIVAIMFWGFNILMGVWIYLGVGVTSEGIDGAKSGAEAAGAAVGGALGIGMIGIIWFFGAIILGIMMLFTRGRKITETREK